MPIFLRRKWPRAPHPQSQSRLFCLPVELRTNIFTRAVTAPTIPLRRIGAPYEFSLLLQTVGCGGRVVYVIRAQRLLSLLQTCAHGHAEALPLLYSVNTFQTGDPVAVRLLAQSVGASFVRRLDFHWTMSKAPEKPRTRLIRWLRSERLEEGWPKVWEAIKHLDALRWLQVQINVPILWTRQWREMEGVLLQPLSNILREGAQGRLILTWDRDAKSSIAAEELLSQWAVERQLSESDRRLAPYAP
jgi:hypothetical protein